MGISLVQDAGEMGIVGNLLLAFKGYETYEIAMNGAGIKYIYRIKDHRKIITKQNVTIWYNIHMYPFIKSIGYIWVDGSLEAVQADKLNAEFVPLDSTEIYEMMDKILAEYVIARVGDKL